MNAAGTMAAGQIGATQTGVAPGQGRIFTYESGAYSVRDALGQDNWTPTNTDRTARRVIGWSPGGPVVVWDGAEYLDLEEVIAAAGSDVAMLENPVDARISRDGKWAIVSSNYVTNQQILLIRLPC